MLPSTLQNVISEMSKYQRSQ
ncbi:hypothetical protein E2C01_097404 [Portunus trituberculatus]|uniref:Uncharacterized protein n=1 Tax=Portunus trituberculatus TaxID=210409 RepID=A0A5B7K9V1_PORTR|nr:hypothetical protein [Portunus trituberculatus]